jgi:hypothetical protein
MTNLKDSLWEVYNDYTLHGVMIISYEDFRREIERICLQEEQRRKGE